MTKGVPNLERGFVRPKLGTPFSFLRCFPFCGRVLRTAPLDTVLLLVIGVIFLSLGIWREEYAIVMSKAINICLECIGIG